MKQILIFIKRIKCRFGKHEYDAYWFDGKYIDHKCYWCGGWKNEVS